MKVKKISFVSCQKRGFEDFLGLGRGWVLSFFSSACVSRNRWVASFVLVFYFILCITYSGTSIFASPEFFFFFRDVGLGGGEVSSLLYFLE